MLKSCKSDRYVYHIDIQTPDIDGLGQSLCANKQSVLPFTTRSDSLLLGCKAVPLVLVALQNHTHLQSSIYAHHNTGDAV